VGQEAFAHRYLKLPPVYKPNDGLKDLDQLNREDLEKLGMVSLKEISDPTPIVPGAYLTGNIERITEYEKGSPLLLIKRGERLENDLFQGEQSLVFNVKGRGLVVLSSCAHAGIINTVRQARKISGVEKLHAVLGGFHLTGAPAEKIQKTVADMKALNPDYIVPMHCTGWQAIMAFQQAMPQQFVLNMAGTKYVFPS
jgi:7,8-dihydropterin-6-yl-methyl-4-(beta-D-ribofuranosyl)aminobenzene 5'-phosphate synthase